MKNLLQSINENSLIHINGHADQVGSDKYNLDLSEKRALSVQRYIIKHTGLHKNQFAIKFYGEEKPVNTGNTDENRSMNRRVSVKILSH